MKVTGKARRGLVDAVAEARDEALVEIGREAALRQKERAGKARRQRLEKVAAATAVAGAALAAGAMVVRARARRKDVEIPLNGTPESPK